jgi:hypothetical protein
MPTSFSCQRSFVPFIKFRSERLRSRRSAESVWGRICDTANSKKNPARAPGESADHIRRKVRAPLGRMCSKLDFFLSGIRNQPHLWMSRQARSVSSQSPESGLHQLPASIAKSKFPSSCIHKSFGSFLGAHLWISRSIVENCPPLKS